MKEALSVLNADGKMRILAADESLRVPGYPDNDPNSWCYDPLVASGGGFIDCYGDEQKEPGS